MLFLNPKKKKGRQNNIIWLVSIGGWVGWMVVSGVPPVEKIKCWMWGTCVVRGNRFGTSCTKTTPGHLKEMIKNGYKKDLNIYAYRTTNSR
jgi:hypothetical protein